MGIEEYCITDLEAMMEQESALTQAQCPAFLHHTVAEYHRHTWFVLHQDDRLICTEKGTRPGDGFADILWSLIFSKWIAKLEARLIGSGDFQSLQWNGLPGIPSRTGDISIPRSLIAWADDVVILGTDTDGQHLVDKLQFTCSAMVQELIQFGLQLNFKEGKTEAIVDIRGKGSTALRRTLFQDQKGQLVLDTPMPEQPTLRMVASYKHLGGILTHGSKLLPEVKHRIGQGCTAFHNYRTKIYKNKNIDVDTRMTVLRATTLAAMHYNAATWMGHTQKTTDTWRTGHMNLYRRALKGLFPYQELLHYTDDEILTIVDENAPDETLALLRLRWYGAALRIDCPTFWATLAFEATWLSQVQQDLAWMYNQLRGFTNLREPAQDLDAWHLLIQQQYPRWQGLLKRSAAHARLQRRIHTNVHKYHRRCLRTLRDFALPVPDEEEQQLQQAYFCFACDKSFLNLSAWSVHAFKAHGRVNRWRRLQEGNVCKACARQFPSNNRLLRHLQNSTSCAKTVASLRLWTEVQPGYGSTAVNSQDRNIALETWRPTDAPTEPPRQGWAMTEQVQSFLRWCTTRDWCQDDILEATMHQLKQHSLYDKEIEDVQQALRLDIEDEEQGRAMDEIFATLIRLSRPSQTTTTRRRTTMECVQALDSLDTDLRLVVPRTPTKFRYVLHLFAGVKRDHDVHSLLDHVRVPDGTTIVVASLDIVLSKQFGDLLHPGTQDHWIRMATEGMIHATISGPPCESWSIARWHEDEGYQGPKPIRNGDDINTQVWAKSPLRIRDLRQLDVANQLLLFACLLFLIQILTKGCAILEHPQLPEKRNGQQPASIWKLGIITFLLNLPDVYALDIKQGYWGAASPKPTRLMVTMPGVQEADLYRWLNAHRTTSRLPQPIKMGRDTEGHYRTAPLKRYPPGLCRGISYLCQKAAEVIPHEVAEDDALEEIFETLEKVYLESAHNDTHDGADYVPQKPP